MRAQETRDAGRRTRGAGRHVSRFPLAASRFTKVAALTCLIAAPTSAQRPVYFERTGLLPAHISESSGVAVSRRQDGVLWTHNDSANDPVIYAVDLRGELLGAWVVRGADNEDWEDIAAGPCPEEPAAACLYIADTGNNLRRRSSVAVYVVREPDVAARARNGRRETQRVHRLTITYPDGSRDVEALAVAPDGEISLISKGRSGVLRRYRIPADAVRRESVVALAAESLGVSPQPTIGRQVTGAAVSPDGATFVVRTYTELWFYRLDEAGGIHPLGAACWLGPREPQGEAVDFLDDHTLVLTSEAAFGQPAAISTVRCPRPAQRRPIAR